MKTRLPSRIRIALDKYAEAVELDTRAKVEGLTVSAEHTTQLRGLRREDLEDIVTDELDRVIAREAADDGACGHPDADPPRWQQQQGDR